jgi:Leucine-rich repeat (LRR) protein
LNENISWRIGQLDQLEKLSLYGNKLTGELPEEFVSTPLEELTLSENDFTGAIPDAFSNMPSLKVLSLHQKTNTQGGFTGEVPDFKGSVNLQLLNLASNSLSSYLPETFMEDSELKGEKITVDLSHNTIRGKIPLSWDMFGYLNINLSDNFIDDMPEKLCSMQGWQDGVLGAMDGCNPILCEKGSFNAYGRATPGNECVPCPGSEFYGATTCLSLGSSEIWWTLETFYASTNGDEWSGGDGWLSSPNPCDGTWAGITCDNDNIDIIEIDLSESGLTGTPDPIIFTLPRLEVLKLAFNDIDFTFDGIENAKYLRSLHLSGTRVSSLEGVGKAKPLTQLHLTSSYLFGQIPDELYDLTNLRGLFMNYNELTGRISPKIGQLQNLEELFLLKNDLTGQIPATIGNLQKMKNLSLSQNYLVGSIPESINKMKDLEILALQGEGSDISDIDRRKLKLQTRRTQAYSGLTGTLPSLNGLKKVKEVYLGFNSISGKIPYNFLAGVEDKTKEITIELESNSLSGVVPASLTQFDSLNLYIGANKFNGIASGLCSMNNWFAGDVGTFKCDAIMCPKDTFSQWGRRDEDAVCEQCPDGTVTPYMGSFECVSAEEQAIEDEKTVLKLMYDSLDGIGWHSQGNWYDDSVSFCDWHGITCTSGLQSIQAIHLGENGLKGILPNSVFDLPNLMELNLARNVITINFDYIGSASKLEYLNLDSTGQTNLSGINSAPSLTLLHASNNDFAQFPPELLTMTNLKVLYLSTNKFDSKIPDLSGLNQLAFFACKKCGFTGKLPSWLGNLANLQYLSLASNKLTGEIPTGLTEMNSLTHLDLSDQAPRGGGITGSIPSFSNSENISELYLHRNKLSGSISDDFLAMTTSSTVTVDLRWNSISGSVPQTLKDRGFEEFILLLAENKIDNIPTSICSLEGWNQGDLLTFQCEGLLCENGYYSPIGRATDGYECVECPATEDVDTQTYYGSTTCGTSDEMNALEKMYYALGGPDWTNNYSWLENDIYCTWYGIDCDEDEQIIGLDLSWNNLVGEVPREMFDLVTLTYLSLKNNAITVNFDGIEKLSSLETLNLSEVGLTSIAGIGAASSLVELHLTNNELTSIPDDLYSLTKLESLLMNYNKVEGSLSPKIGQLAAIREIFMYRNKLSGNLPTEIGNLNNVEILSLGKLLLGDFTFNARYQNIISPSISFQGKIISLVSCLKGSTTSKNCELLHFSTPVTMVQNLGNQSLALPVVV